VSLGARLYTLRRRLRHDYFAASCAVLETITSNPRRNGFRKRRSGIWLRRGCVDLRRDGTFGTPALQMQRQTDEALQLFMSETESRYLSANLVYIYRPTNGWMESNKLIRREAGLPY
jgi:hypothetical protein